MYAKEPFCVATGGRQAKKIGEFNGMKNENGAIALEASLSLTLFIFFVLFIYSFFIIFTAQTKIQHALLQSSQSLSLDAYYSENITADVTEADGVLDLLVAIGLNSVANNSAFVSTEKWYESESGVTEVAKERFLAYFSNGDSDKADEMLEGMNVVDGISGLDFSECKVDEDGNICLSVTYKIKYMFDYQALGLDAVTFKSTACSRLWK